MINFIEQIIFVFFISLIAFFLSLAQSIFGSRIGTDYPSHAFLCNAIRNNNGRLFLTVPGLLNVAHCAALPLYLHSLLSHVPVRFLKIIELTLNPLVNTLHVLLVYIIIISVADTQWSNFFSTFLLGAFALTPQFFHSLSARNFGLSARGIGLLFLTAFLACVAQTALSPVPEFWWVLTIIFGWFVWGFSTFAIQAAIFISIFIFLLGGWWQSIVGLALGLLVFICVHYKYSISYLIHTWRYLKAYSKELAPIYILERRPSIWVDFVKDFWTKPSQVGIKKALMYVYGNSLLIVIVLNPLCLIAVGGWITDDFNSTKNWETFTGTVAAAGLITMFITTFRVTRFLGEPERYVEAVTPWAIISSGFTIVDHGVSSLILPITSIYLIFSLIQVLGSWILTRTISVSLDELEIIRNAINLHVKKDVRFCCNNEQITKLLLGNPWRYAFYIAVGQDYGGMNAIQAFIRFPFLRLEACERIIEAYRVNTLLLDRQIYDDVFNIPPVNLRKIEVIYESERYKVLVLDWKN